MTPWTLVAEDRGLQLPDMRWDKIVDRFLQHIRAPFHRGKLPAAVMSAVCNHPTCSDRILLQLLVDPDDQITDAWHDGNGCITSLAAASLLCEHIEGKSLSELRKMTKTDMLSLLGIQLTPLRQQCAFLAYYALQTILASSP